MSLLALLTACGGLGLEASVEDTAEAQGSVRVDSISPAFGPVTGGTEVTLTGEGFDGAVYVAFGNAEVTAVRIAADTIVVATPDAGAPMTVDVTVRSDAGEATVTDGFTFGDGADTGGTDTGGGGGDTGEGDTGGLSGTTGLVEFSMLVYGCPACFGLSQQAVVTANAAFHGPVRASWLDWLPAIGACVTNVSPSAPADDYFDAGDWLYLSAGSTSIGLRGTIGADGTRYAASSLATTDFIRSAAFDLRVSGGVDVPAFDAVDAVRTPQGFDDLQPIELLNDETQAFGAVIARNAATFSWAPSGGDGSFVVLMEVFRPDGSALLGNVLCRGADNGRMTVPSTYLSSFPRGALLAVTLQRYQIGNFPTPNGGTAEAVATLGAVGTGVLQ